MTDTRARLVELLPRLRRFAYALTGDLDQGDDLVQEACVRALGSLDQWQPDTRLDSWMYKIAQNIWIDRARARKVRGETVDIDEVHDLSGSDGRVVTENRLMLRKVIEGLRRLPVEQRVLVSLVYVDGQSYKDAAEITGVPIGTVMSRLARARNVLGAGLEGRPVGGVQSTVGGRHGSHNR